jgi:hypothetical protein
MIAYIIGGVNGGHDDAARVILLIEIYKGAQQKLSGMTF